MSPWIVPLPFIEPNQDSGGEGGTGGMTWAMGSPLRVISIGWPVRFTLSNRERHVALNFEIGTCSTELPFIKDYGQ